MVRVAVMYPNNPGSRFDWPYYLNSHIPLVLRRFGSACRGTTVEEGVAGMAGASAPYVAIVQFLFDSAEAFQQTFGPHADELLGDIPNYTDIQPAVQISEIRMASPQTAV